MVGLLMDVWRNSIRKKWDECVGNHGSSKLLFFMEPIKPLFAYVSTAPMKLHKRNVGVAMVAII